MLTSSDGPNRLGSAELEGSGSVKLEGSVRFGVSVEPDSSLNRTKTEPTSTSEIKKRRILITVFCTISLISATIVMVLYHTYLRHIGSNKASDTIVTTTGSNITEEGNFISN